MGLIIDDRCPRCWQVDYLPMANLQARCRRCRFVYQRREAAGGDQVPAASKKTAGWSIGRVLHCPACDHPAYVRMEGAGRRCWSCDHVWDPEQPEQPGQPRPPKQLVNAGREGGHA